LLAELHEYGQNDSTLSDQEARLYLLENLQGDFEHAEINRLHLEDVPPPSTLIV